jgi:hypothetical protein
LDQAQISDEGELNRLHLLTVLAFHGWFLRGEFRKALCAGSDFVVASITQLVEGGGGGAQNAVRNPLRLPAVVSISCQDHEGKRGVQHQERQVKSSVHLRQSSFCHDRLIAHGTFTGGDNSPTPKMARYAIIQPSKKGSTACEEG